MSRVQASPDGRLLILIFYDQIHCSVTRTDEVWSISNRRKENVKDPQLGLQQTKTDSLEADDPNHSRDIVIDLVLDAYQQIKNPYWQKFKLC